MIGLGNRHTWHGIVRPYSVTPTPPTGACQHNSLLRPLVSCFSALRVVALQAAPPAGVNAAAPAAPAAPVVGGGPAHPTIDMCDYHADLTGDSSSSDESDDAGDANPAAGAQAVVAAVPAEQVRNWEGRGGQWRGKGGGCWGKEVQGRKGREGQAS